MDLRLKTRHSLAGVLGPLAVVALATSFAAAAIAPAPRGLATSANEFLVVLDQQQPTATALTNLAQAGFPTVEQIRVLPRYGKMRILRVPATDEHTRATILAVPGVVAVRQVFRRPGSEVPLLPNGQVIVKFRPGTPQAQAEAIAVAAGCTVARQIVGLPQTYVLNPNDRTAEPAAVAAQLRGNPQVVYSHPSLLIKLKKLQAATVIEDTLYPFQWHLNNTGQLPGAVPGADVKAPQAWLTSMGAGATVAVIDDCIQWDHEDLRDNYITGYDYVDLDGDPGPQYGADPIVGFDPTGDFHGTCVSGIICARANQVGVRGVAPFAGLVGAKVSLWLPISDQDLADAFLFCERNGAQAINNSWGLPGETLLPVVPSADLYTNDLINDAIHEVATNGRGGLGVLVLFAAGNESLPVSYGNVYAANPDAMAIGATLRDDKLACYSNFGAEQSVVAPGGGFMVPPESIYSLMGLQESCYESDIATTDVYEVPGLIPWDDDGDGFLDPSYPLRGLNPPMKFLDVIMSSFEYPCPNTNPGALPFCVPLVPDLSINDFPNPDYTHHMNGTSAACPVATGVAALVFSVNPNLTAEQVRNIMEHTADKILTANEQFDKATGHNQRYGHGRLNAARAVEAAAAGRNWPSPVKDVINVSSQTTTQLFWTNPVNDASGILIARSTGPLNWAPTDGIEYAANQIVFDDSHGDQVVIVSTDLVSKLEEHLQAGDYNYAIFVRNGSNNYSWGRRSSVGAGGGAGRPLASVSASPKVGPAPLKVHFAGGGIDKTGLVTFTWNFGDGTGGSGAAIDHTYARGGTYLATLTVTNAVNLTAQATAQIVVTSAGNKPPVASVTAAPTSGEAPMVVVFQATASDPDGTIVRYDWNFGDGSVGSGRIVEHIYLLPGVYGASVTAIDDGGSVAVATQVINVTGSGATAGVTVPADALKSEGLPGFCGAGTAGAVALSALALAGFMRRRR